MCVGKDEWGSWGIEEEVVDEGGGGYQGCKGRAWKGVYAVLV
jgi:hypothetical protein